MANDLAYVVQAVVCLKVYMELKSELICASRPRTLFGRLRISLEPPRDILIQSCFKFYSVCTSFRLHFCDPLTSISSCYHCCCSTAAMARQEERCANGSWIAGGGSYRWIQCRYGDGRYWKRQWWKSCWHFKGEVCWQFLVSVPIDNLVYEKF